MAELAFDPGAYLDSITATVPQPDLPEVTPKKLTYYFPATPEETRAKGLSYGMEGGIHGGPGFGELDLRNHTLEKFRAGESPFVAVAMHGRPTGDMFKMMVEGKPIIAKNVDTGGGLIPGQTDIATSNPELAKGGGYGGASVQAVPQAATPETAQAPIQMEPIELPTSEPEKKQRRAAPTASDSAPIPQITVNVPQRQQFELPQAQPLPTGVGESVQLSDFSKAVQEAALNPQPESLMASTSPFDPAAYLASQTPTPAPSPTQTPTVAFDPGTYLAEQTSRSEVLPTPIGGQGEPDLVTKAVRAGGKYVGQMIPQSLEQAVAMTGAPTSLDPRQIAEFVAPPARLAMGVGEQAYNRMQQIREADKTPALSQQRFDAGIGTALDVIGMGTAMGGVKKFYRPPKPRGLVASTREIPAGWTDPVQPKGATFSDYLRDLSEGNPVTLYHGTQQSGISGLKAGTSLTHSRQLAEKFAGSGGTVHEVQTTVPESNPLRWSAKSLLDDIKAGRISEADAQAEFMRRASEVKLGDERPAPQLSEPLQFSVDMPTDMFGTEHTPIANFLMTGDGVMSKSTAKRLGLYQKNPALWENAPSLAHPTHGKLYPSTKVAVLDKNGQPTGKFRSIGAGGETPDNAAKALYRAGLIPDEYVDTMWEALGKESRSARNTLEAQRAEAKTVGEGAKQKFTQDKAFNAAEQAAWKGGEPAIPVKDLQVGDTVTVGGEQFKVTDIDPDTFDVTLEDGRKFGVQTVSDQTVIYGEHEGTGATQPPAATPPPAPPTQPQLPLPPEPPRTPPTLNPVADRGPFRRTYRVDKELGEMMDAIGAAPEHGALVSELRGRNMLHEMTPQQEANLGRLLVSERMKGVNPDHPMILSADEAKAIAENPAIKKALDYYRKEIEPEVEELHIRAGTKEEAVKKQRGSYITLIPERLPDGSIPQFVRRASEMSRTTKFARPAEGMAERYSTNIRDILRETYTESIRKAATRDLYNAVEAKGVAEPSPYFVHDPEGGPNSGKWVRAVKWKDLPPSIKHDLDLIARRGTNIAPEGFQKFLQAYQRGATSVQLGANPIEVQSHMRRGLNVLAAKPPVGYGILARLEPIFPYFGPKLGTLKRMLSEFTPEREQIAKELTAAGAGSSRGFSSRYVIKKVPGLKQVSEFTHELLWGTPKGKGVKGWEYRLRTVLEQIRRNVEPAYAHDKQRMRQNGNQMGQYGTMQSWPIRALLNVNPYAATTLPMRAAELRTLFADPNFKGESLPKATLHRMETFMRGTGGTIIALSLANKLLAGNWPWETDKQGKGHEFDLKTGVQDKDGNDIYIPNRFISPEFFRAISTLSIPSLVREARSDNQDFVSAAGIGPMNAAASLVNSPALGISLAALPQWALYAQRQPGEHGYDIMKVGRLSKDEKARGVPPLLKRAEGVAEQVHPALSAILGYMDEPIKGLRPLGIYTVDKPRSEGGNVSQFFK